MLDFGVLEDLLFRTKVRLMLELQDLVESDITALLVPRLRIYVNLVNSVLLSSLMPIKETVQLGISVFQEQQLQRQQISQLWGEIFVLQAIIAQPGHPQQSHVLQELSEQQQEVFL